ncbi:hypothetical protein BJ994_000424 [Arthrobacter pigmenti]|uniref:D-inositol 3-phosphate glycosyltransferase n=1 Tax=Arthrobacter pigmenti TaxID=271432 RepID=A0A846RDZ7_9MICC|nr:glycosyltransferase [Arthrobacter pigmenti]NJC21348.1 hypothetical protein [Arthrobacter pigmenti]
MKILLWHVHGGWTDAFVRGPHQYVLPTTPDGGPWGLGRAGRDWPESVIEVAPKDLREHDFDVVVLQRTEELAECELLLGRRPGRDIPAVFLEHNTPKGDIPSTRHPLTGQAEIPVVHVTHFNDVFWDCGTTPTMVVEHGIVDPGHRYTGELDHLAAVVNEPVRRGRVTGTDLLPRFARAAHLDVFGMGTEKLPATLGLGPDELTVCGDLPTHSLHAELARRRAYVHPMRWTSLGLSLLEAMHLGLPVVALATTEAARAVPPEAGAISTDVDELCAMVRLLMEDPDEARARGTAARQVALERYGLDAFLEAWNEVLARTAERTRILAVPERRAQ